MFKFKNKNLVFYVILVCCILFLASSISFLRPAALNIFKYPLELLTLIGREAKGIIFYHSNFIENVKLKKNIDLLKNRLNSLNELYFENKRLKELLSFKQNAAYKVIAARVIGRSSDNWSSVVMIDKGSAQGIKRGFIATSYLGLAGRVIEVSQYTSKVILINDPGLAVSSINQRSRQDGLVSGALGSFLVMKYLPKDADIRIGDVVITSGLTGIYPKGLVIGKIVDIAEEFSGLAHYCLIKPAVNLSSIEEVLIIIP